MRRFERVMKLVQRCVLVVVVVNLALTLVAQAQDVGPPMTPAATWTDALAAVVKAVAPSALAFLSAYLTKAISWALSFTPAPWLGMVSSAIGSLGAALTAAAEGLSVEAVQVNAVTGAGAGAIGHAMLQSKPIAST